MKKFSVIIPCYNEEATVLPFYREMENVRKKDFDNIEFEYIFVDDGSSDRTLEIIKELRENDSKVKYISFSRNFGKEAAIYAGLKKAEGEYVTLMDSDLQDPPSMLREMYDAVENEGYDQVGTRRVTRKGEPILRSIFARNFYRIINIMSDITFTDGARDYRLMKRCVVDAVLALSEKDRFSKGIFSYVGFKTKWLEYENVERVGGESKWSFYTLCKYAIGAIVSFSTALLALPIVFGILFFLGAVALFVLAGVLCNAVYAVCGATVLTSAVVMLMLGVIGKYIGQNSTELKSRPMYFIREQEDDGDNK